MPTGTAKSPTVVEDGPDVVVTEASTTASHGDGSREEATSSSDGSREATSLSNDDSLDSSSSGVVRNELFDPTQSTQDEQDEQDGRESAGETDDDRSTFDGIDMYEEDEHIAKETAELPNSSSGDDDGEPPVTASKKRKSPPPQAKKRKKDPNAPKNARYAVEGENEKRSREEKDRPCKSVCRESRGGGEENSRNSR